MYRFGTLIAAAAALCAFGLAHPVQADDVKDKDAGDTHFVKEAASGGMLEVKLGKLATENAASADVRKFGERMVTDHSKANKQLMSIADKNSYKVPGELNKKDQATFDKLKELKGAEFDRAYMKTMLKDHENDIAEFTKASKECTDPTVKAFALKTLPTLKEHLMMAKEVEAKLDGKDKNK